MSYSTQKPIIKDFELEKPDGGGEGVALNYTSFGGYSFL